MQVHLCISSLHCIASLHLRDEFLQFDCRFPSGFHYNPGDVFLSGIWEPPK